MRQPVGPAGPWIVQHLPELAALLPKGPSGSPAAPLSALTRLSGKRR
jgi:hypothetical protein